MYGRHIANNLMYFDGKILVGDFQASEVYRMTYDAINDDGEPMLKRFILPVVNVGRAQMSIYSLELDMKTGIGQTNGPSADPKAALRVSKDKGKTWSSSKLTKLGRKGRYNTRAKWNKLGMARQFTLEITITADVDLDIGGAWVEVN